MTKLSSISCAALLALTAFALAPRAGFAQTYPTRQPIHLVVPFAPGGATDVAARLVAAEMGKQLAQTVIVDNKPGGAGAIGADFVAKAPPDGYTACFCTTGPIVILPQIDPKLPYHPERDLLPVAHVHNADNVLIARPGFEATTMRELASLARERDLSLGSPGAGGTQHLGGLWLASELGVRFTHVPYKGEAPAYTDLAGGQIDLAIGSALNAAPLIKDGKARAVANLGLTRSKLMPDVPTVAEQGYPNFSFYNFVGLHVPAGTPQPLIDQLAAAAASSVKNAQLQEKFAGLGLEPVGSGPEAYAALIKREAANWERVLKTVKIDRE